MAAGYLAVPQRGYGPGVLILHAWWGLTPFFKNVCECLAGEVRIQDVERETSPTARMLWHAPVRRQDEHYSFKSAAGAAPVTSGRVDE
jgi:Dienelactone hydrolase family